MSPRIFIIGVSVFVLISQLVLSIPAISKENQIDTLRVALYPYVPNRLSLFQKIEEVLKKLEVIC